MPVIPAISRPARRANAAELRGADEARPVVRAPRQQAQHVLGAQDREQVRLRVAVDRGEDERRRRAWPARARGDDPRGSRHVLEHLHAGDDVERRGDSALQRFGRDEAVVDRDAGFEPCSRATPRALSDRSMPVTCAPRRGHRLGEDAAAASDVERRACRRGRRPSRSIQPSRSGLISCSGRNSLCRIPPAMRERREFRELGGVDVRAMRVARSIIARLLMRVLAARRARARHRRFVDRR